jgi:hypothetical protein
MIGIDALRDPVSFRSASQPPGFPGKDLATGEANSESRVVASSTPRLARAKGLETSLERMPRRELGPPRYSWRPVGPFGTGAVRSSPQVKFLRTKRSPPRADGDVGDLGDRGPLPSTSSRSCEPCATVIIHIQTTAFTIESTGHLRYGLNE